MELSERWAKPNGPVQKLTTEDVEYVQYLVPQAFVRLGGVSDCEGKKFPTIVVQLNIISQTTLHSDQFWATKNLDTNVIKSELLMTLESLKLSIDNIISGLNEDSELNHPS